MLINVNHDALDGYQHQNQSMTQFRNFLRLSKPPSAAARGVAPLLVVLQAWGEWVCASEVMHCE